MLILATDTSGKYGSIALARGNPESVQAIEVVPIQGGTFSAQLVPQISGLLSKHRLSKSELDAFAVVSGPGSFTGLRVGLAAIKALAEILHKPIAAVSLLELISFEIRVAFTTSPGQAQGAPILPDVGRSGSNVLTALDAGRNEAYVGEYRVGAGLPVCIAESLLSFDQLQQRAGELPVCTPDENVFTKLTSRDNGSSPVSVIRIDRPNAASVAQLGYKKILAGQTIAPEALDATYIRRADAEINTQLRKQR